MEISPLHQIDFYKSGHVYQYPENTELVFSNLTPRASRMPEVDRVVFFTLQYFIKEYLMRQWQENFFDRDLTEIIIEFQGRMDRCLGVGKVKTHHIEELHHLGYLPLEIRAVPEGSRVNLRVPMMVMWNTNKKFEWLTNYLETIMSTTVWGGCTSATMSNEYRGIMELYAERTGGDPSFVDFQGHDFSCRGMFGFEAGCMSGAAHLLSFKGTDTVGAVDFIEKYYRVRDDKAGELIGSSVPATEHSVMCLGGDGEDEYETIKRLITETYPTGPISIVCDTWDFFKVLTDTLPRLKDIIMARDGCVIIRPDSGDPADIICGTNKIESVVTDYVTDIESLKDWAIDGIRDEVCEDTPHGEGGESEVTRHYSWEGNTYEIKVDIDWDRYDKQYYFIDGVTVVSCEIAKPTPEQKGAVELLWETFGGTTTEKGYRQLDKHIGLIYGDSITLDRCRDICSRLSYKGYASTNVVFGIGSYTYQYTTRDVFGFAVKATYAEIDGNPVEIYKKPKTDDGTKNSAKGLTAVHMASDGNFYMNDQATWEQVRNCALELVYRDGVLIRNTDISEIRETLRRQR